LRARRPFGSKQKYCYVEFQIDAIRYSFGLSKQQVERLQEILDADGAQPSNFADRWFVSDYAAEKDVARMRDKVGANSMAELLIKAQRAGAITLTYDPGRGDAPFVVLPAAYAESMTPAENVHSGVLDSARMLPYNVPDLARIRVLRSAPIGEGRTGMGSLARIPRPLAETRDWSGLRSLDNEEWLEYCGRRTARND
jgi:hypothetical protein